MCLTSKEVESVKLICEELQTTLEDLQLRQEEMRLSQNEQLAPARAAVEAERQRYQELFEFAPDGYLVTDAAGTIQEANRAAAMLLNISQKFLLSLPLVVFVAEQERWFFRSEINRLSQVDGVKDWEVRLCPRNSEPIDAALSVAVIRNQEGNPVALGWLLRDITERKRMQAALCQANEKLELLVQERTKQLSEINEELKKEITQRKKAEENLARISASVESSSDGITNVAEKAIYQNQALLNLHGSEPKRAEEIHRVIEKEKELSQLQLRFFSMASHEFRTPLSTILVSAQLLQHYNNEPSKEEKRIRNVQRIEAAAKHMIHLLNDILTINRAETGKLEFNPKVLDLEKLCRKLIEEMQLSAGKQYTITFGSQGSYKNAYMDEKLLRSILVNLLSNAIKYSHVGGSVHLTLAGEEGEAIFRIRDEGIGIPPEDQQHLFETFHRGKNVGTIAGTGLGLTVVKKCVDLHGGRITVASVVGVGTTSTVTLPLRGSRE